MVQDEAEVRGADVPPTQSLVWGLLRTARPKQWLKNVLVFAAPGAAGVLSHATPLWQSLVAFTTFCLAASGTYFLNDAADVESDRQHPTKHRRPIAAGIVPVGTARVAGVVLLLCSVGLSFAASWQLAVTVASYVTLTTLYSSVLKHIVVFDIIAVAAGFVLRAIAGAAATDVPVSNWFFLVASFGATFVVTGKRHGEAAEIGADAASMRSTLGEYSVAYLAYVKAVSSTGALLAYCLWAFEKADEAANGDPWYQLSIVPFVLGVLRYALLIDQRKGAAPEEIFVSDRQIQLIGLAWVLVFGIGIYRA